MLFRNFILLCLSGMGLAQATSINMASVLSEASVLMSVYPATTLPSISFVAPGGNLLQPPASLIGAIITAVPATVLAELVQPSLRSSIASEFKAGNTPSWYATLPPAVKSYIEALATQVTAGSVNLSATPSPVTLQGPTETKATTAVGVAVKSTTSSKALAAQVTGGVGISLVAAVGILGVVIAL